MGVCCIATTDGGKKANKAVMQGKADLDAISWQDKPNGLLRFQFSYPFYRTYAQLFYERIELNRNSAERVTL